VFAASSNPISTGIVADLSLPGSNVTSLSLGPGRNVPLPGTGHWIIRY
jgi:hypothetical protein